ncbi:MAG: hypothetical protein MUC63_10845 [Planctomycetes bacterium]|nr:hypothetical protein [Planctomycetota bacterium]
MRRRLWACCLALWSAAVSFAAAGEPRAPLPEGDAGIAARHPGDAGIGDDPGVAFAEDFEVDSVEALKARWTEVRNPREMSLSGESPAGGAGKRSLLYTHVGGRGEGGHLYKSFPRGFDKVHLRYYTRIDEACHPIHHFVHLGGYDPPTAWPQGGAGVRPDGGKRFTTAVEPHGPAWKWEYYTYWMDMRGSPPRGQTWGNLFVGEGAPPVRRGRWTCLELMVKLNRVGSLDGEQALWVDGKLVSHLGKGFPKGLWTFDRFLPGKGGKGIRWDDERGGRAEFEVPEGGAPFEGFRWRSSPDLNVNFLWLLVFITGAPEGHESRIWFDHVVLAREYVGPIRARDEQRPEGPFRLRLHLDKQQAGSAMDVQATAVVENTSPKTAWYSTLRLGLMVEGKGAHYSVRVVYNLTREDAELARRMGKAEGVQVPEDALWVGRQLSEPVALEIK